MIPTFFWQPIQDFCIRTKNRLWSIPTPVSRDVTQNENVSLNNPFQEHNNSLGNELEKCATDAFIHPSRIRKTQGWNSLDSLTRWIIYKEMSLFFSFQFKIFLTTVHIRTAWMKTIGEDQETFPGPKIIGI